MKPFLLLLLAASPIALAQQTQQTTVTTTEKKSVQPATVIEQETRVVQPSHAAGNVASVDPRESTLLLSVAGSPAPLRFYFDEQTNFVDASGDPLTHQAVKTGQGVTLDYVKAGDRLIITRAHLQPMGAIEKIMPETTATEQTTVPLAPSAIEQTTTTTTTE